MDFDTSGYTQVTTTRPRAVAFLPTTVLASVLRVLYLDLILKFSMRVMYLFVSVDKEFLFLHRHLWATHSVLWLDQKYVNTQVRVNVWPQVCESLLVETQMRPVYVLSICLSTHHRVSLFSSSSMEVHGLGVF